MSTLLPSSAGQKKPFSITSWPSKAAKPVNWCSTATAEEEPARLGLGLGLGRYDPGFCRARREARRPFWYADIHRVWIAERRRRRRSEGARGVEVGDMVVVVRWRCDVYRARKG